MDTLTPEQRSERMRRIKSKDTKPELRLRKELHRLGLRYKLHDKGLPGKPDIVFRGSLLAVQVRGCFWHMHNCSIGHLPKSGTDYWRAKLEGNVERDKRNDDLVRRLGWKVIVVWECDINSPGEATKKAASIARDVALRKKKAIQKVAASRSRK